MTTEYPSDATVTSPEQFNAALTRLIQQATEQGVDVTGAWECYTDGDHPHWEAVVVELDNDEAHKH